LSHAELENALCGSLSPFCERHLCLYHHGCLDFSRRHRIQAQQKPLHVNPVIAKLAEGKTVYGLITGDVSVANARDTSGASMRTKSTIPWI
jgi:hypothetical protein